MKKHGYEQAFLFDNIGLLKNQSKNIEDTNDVSKERLEREGKGFG